MCNSSIKPARRYCRIVAAPPLFLVLKIVGAVYLLWLAWQAVRKGGGFRLAAAARQTPTLGQSFLAGVMIDLLNPKVGIFYVSFLPQFLPTGDDPARFGFLLAAIHVAETLLWFAALIAATVPIAGLLRLPVVVKWLDRVTGGVFVAFGLRLALERR